MLAKYPFVLVVSKGFAAHSVGELIALAKSRPGAINYASVGNGSGQHLSAELFKLVTGTNLTHVPYRGAQPAYTDVIAGQVPVFFDNLANALGQIEGGTVRALAVTGSERSPQLPDVPTVAEAGVPGYENYVWFGLWAPKRTPQPTLDRLHAEVKKALADPTVKEASERRQASRSRCRATRWSPSSKPRSRNGPRWSNAPAWRFSESASPSSCPRIARRRRA
jgi:tripartite-type tricarboxylate transporter receptor subunit TctC